MLLMIELCLRATGDTNGISGADYENSLVQDEGKVAMVKIGVKLG